MYISHDGQLHCSELVSKTPERWVACRQSVLVPSFPHRGDDPIRHNAGECQPKIKR